MSEENSQQHANLSLEKEQNPDTFSESFPNRSESFGTIPSASAEFRSLRNLSERTETHTLTVRQVAKLFEQAGVSRTERSIVNWCHPNRQGVARLDAFFEENEGRYYITEQSVSRAIEEEQAKLSTSSGEFSKVESVEPTESFERSGNSSFDNHNSRRREGLKSEGGSESEERGLSDLQRKVMDLEITNRVKEQLLERLNRELQDAEEERRSYIERLISDNRRIGELESQLLQLNRPSSNPTNQNQFFAL